jgi:hypothetical protein
MEFYQSSLDVNPNQEIFNKVLDAQEKVQEQLEANSED